jgi:hypothetical protein
MIPTHTLLSPQKIQDQLVNFQNLLQTQEINVETFESVLCQKKWKNINEFFEGWACVIAPWYPEVITNMVFEELIRFQEVFLFKTDTEKSWRKELLCFCINYPDFRSNDNVVLFNKMKEAVDTAEQSNPGMGYTKVNLIPVFGGPMRSKKTKIDRPKKYPTTLDELDFNAFLHPEPNET